VRVDLRYPDGVSNRNSISEEHTPMGQMIAVGSKAVPFSLPDHLGRTVTLGQFAGKRNVMLLFYPLDFTPT
jgi:hypothetical protein